MKNKKIKNPVGKSFVYDSILYRDIAKDLKKVKIKKNEKNQNIKKKKIKLKKPKVY